MPPSPHRAAYQRHTPPDHQCQMQRSTAFQSELENVVTMRCTALLKGIPAQDARRPTGRFGFQGVQGYCIERSCRAKPTRGPMQSLDLKNTKSCGRLMQTVKTPTKSYWSYFACKSSIKSVSAAPPQQGGPSAAMIARPLFVDLIVWCSSAGAEAANWRIGPLFDGELRRNYYRTRTLRASLFVRRETREPQRSGRLDYIVNAS
jgi:hypothetical protein